MDYKNAPANCILSMERIFNAPRSLVWQAWTQSEHIVNWWGPKGMETRVELLDFKVGGHWKFVMKMPNGSDFVGEGTYLEIIPEEKLVTSARFLPMTDGVVLIVELEELDQQTKFTFSVVHPTPEYAKQQFDMGFLNGWGSTFDRLNELMESYH